MTDQPARPQPLTVEEYAKLRMRLTCDICPDRGETDRLLATIDAAKPPAVQVDAEKIIGKIEYLICQGMELGGASETAQNIFNFAIASGLVSTPPAAQVDRDALITTMLKAYEPDGFYTNDFGHRSAFGRIADALISSNLLTPAAQVDKTWTPTGAFESAFVIERIDTDTQTYWGVPSGEAVPCWTTDLNAAIRFSRYIDAENMMWTLASPETRASKRTWVVVGAVLTPAAQAPEAPAAEWRPIETAPKDGTEIIVRGKYSTDAAIVRYDERHKEWRCRADGCDAIESQSDFGTDYRTFDVPNIWQPLPLPPTDPDKGRGE